MEQPVFVDVMEDKMKTNKEKEEELFLLKEIARKNGWVVGKHIFHFLTETEAFAYDNIITKYVEKEAKLSQLQEDKEMFLEMIEEITGLHNIKAEEIKARLFEKLKKEVKK